MHRRTRGATPVRLTRAKVTKFRSIDDSGWVSFDDVTCLVGKNESGKTAFLQALARLRPVVGKPTKYDPVIDYPSKDFGLYRRKHASDPDTVVAVEFELGDAELASVEAAFRNRGPDRWQDARTLEELQEPVPLVVRHRRGCCRRAPARPS